VVAAQNVLPLAPGTDFTTVRNRLHVEYSTRYVLGTVVRASYEPRLFQSRRQSGRGVISTVIGDVPSSYVVLLKNDETFLLVAAAIHSPNGAGFVKM
jgi:hypothetical protein